MFTLNARKISRCFALSAIYCVTVFAGSVILGIPGSVARSDERSVNDGKALLAVALDESRPFANRLEVLQNVSDLPREAKVQFLLSVIRESDDRFAMAGAFSAIRQGIHTPDIVSAVRARISSWTLPTGPWIVQGIVDEGLGDAGSAQAVLPIVRDVLRLTAKRQPPSDPHQRESVVIEVNWSALALVPQGKRADGKLFRDALRVYPEAYMGWVAAYKLGAMDKEMRGLARSVYTDDALGIVVRMAAAIAMQDEDKQAASFALAAGRSFLEEFGARSMQEIFAGTTNIYEADAQVKTTFFRLDNERVLVAFLPLLQGGEPRDLVLSYLNSPNKVVGEFVRLVAARRWPEQVTARLAMIPQDKRATTLAVIDYLHPGLELPVPPEGLTQEEWNTVKSEIKGHLSRPQTEAIRLALDW